MLLLTVVPTYAWWVQKADLGDCSSSCRATRPLGLTWGSRDRDKTLNLCVALIDGGYYPGFSYQQGERYKCAVAHPMEKRTVVSDPFFCYCTQEGECSTLWKAQGATKPNGNICPETTDNVRCYGFCRAYLGGATATGWELSGKSGCYVGQVEGVTVVRAGYHQSAETIFMC